MVCTKKHSSAFICFLHRPSYGILLWYTSMYRPDHLQLWLHNQLQIDDFAIQFNPENFKHPDIYGNISRYGIFPKNHRFLCTFFMYINMIKKALNSTCICAHRRFNVCGHDFLTQIVFSACKNQRRINRRMDEQMDAIKSVTSLLRVPIINCLWALIFIVVILIE